MPEPKILLVEAESAATRRIAEALKDVGCEVPAAAATGKDAVRLAEEGRPDLVLMDINLRGEMDGIEAARRINEKFDIPVVFLAAHDDDEIIQRAGLTEPFGCLIEPFTTREFHTTIKAALHKHAVERELKEKRHRLQERVKELNCLYSISRLFEDPGISVEEAFQGIADLIPPSWQYPEITCARLVVGEDEYTTTNFSQTQWKQQSPIIINGERRGGIEVFYLEERPQSAEGPFLKEERDLINAIGERTGKVVERIQVAT